jgi:hypothetical protein
MYHALGISKAAVFSLANLLENFKCDIRS